MERFFCKFKLVTHIFYLVDSRFVKSNVASLIIRPKANLFKHFYRANIFIRYATTKFFFF